MDLTERRSSNNDVAQSRIVVAFPERQGNHMMCDSFTTAFTVRFCRKVVIIMYHKHTQNTLQKSTAHALDRQSSHDDVAKGICVVAFKEKHSN